MAPDSLGLHTTGSLGFTPSLMGGFVGFLMGIDKMWELCCSPPEQRHWSPTVPAAELRIFLGEGSLSQRCPREGTVSSTVLKGRKECWRNPTAARDSQKHTCARENWERKLISSNQKRDHHWINIYATQATKGPGNRTGWGEKVLENIVAHIGFVRVVVKGFGNSEGEATWNKSRRLLGGFH